MVSVGAGGGAGTRLVAAAVAALFAIPFLYLGARNLSDLGTFWSVIMSVRTLGPLLRTLALAASVSVAAATIGTAAAWLVARTDVRGARLWRVLLPLPLAFPSFMGAMVMLAALAPGGLAEGLLQPFGVERLPRVDGFVGAFIVLTLFTFPYVLLPVGARLRQLPPSVEESARLLGKGGARTFFSVVLPQVRGAIVAGGSLVFLYSVSEFGVVQLMRYETLTRLIYATRLFDRQTSAAASLLLGIVALVSVASERSLAGRKPEIVGERSRPLVVPLAGARTPATIGLALLVGLSLLVPVGVMVWWVVRGVAASGPDELLAQLTALLPAIGNTAAIAVVTAIIAVCLMTPAAYLGARRPGRLTYLVDGMVTAGFALPGIAIALSLVSLTLDVGGPVGALYQTLPLLVSAYIVHFGAQAMRTAHVAIASVPRHMDEAGRMLGASRARRLGQIEIPLMLPGLLAGGGLVLLSVMKELPATLLLAPIGFKTLAVDIWSASESALFARASLSSLVLVATSGILTWLLVIKRSDAFV